MIQHPNRNTTMKTCLKPLLGSLLALGLAGAANAAYFERVDYLAAGGYSAATDTQTSSDAALDLSPDTNTIALFGAQSFSTVLPGGVLDHSYAADAFVTFSGASSALAMSLSHSLAATANAPLVVNSHQQGAFIDLSAVTLRIVGGAGESIGSPVQVTFAGNASALSDHASAVSGGMLGLGLSVARGDTVLGEYLWDVTSSGDQPVNFSFNGVVGEQLTLSAFMLAGAGLIDTNFAQSTLPYTLVDSGATLSGDFSITAVPEPEGFAMLLAGLVAVGVLVRRKNRVC
jgi:hypothetical protein